MPVQVVQTKTALISSATATHSVKFDVAVTLGNWVVIVWRQGTNNRTPGVPVPAAGTWSGVQDFLASNGTVNARIYQWSAQQTGATTDTYAIAIAGANTAVGGIVAYELSGVDVSGTPRGGTGTQNLASSSSWNLIASPGITLPSGAIVIGAAGEAASGWGTLTAPNGFTTRLSSATSPLTSTWVGDNLTAGAGITGAASTTIARAVYTGYQVYLPAPAGGAYTLTVDPGAVAITAQSANLTVARALQMDQAAIADTGQSIDLFLQRAIQAGSASVSVAGQPADLLLSRVMQAAPGAVDCTGQPVDILASRFLVAATATVTASGQSVDLVYAPAGGYVLTTSPGSVSVQGEPVNLLIWRTVQTDPGLVSSAGQPIDLLCNWVLATVDASVSVVGQSAGLLLSRTIQADPWQVSLSGQPVDLLAARVLNPDPAVILIQGESFTLTVGQLAPVPTFILWTSVDFRVPVLSAEAFTVPRMKDEAFFG